MRHRSASRLQSPAAVGGHEEEEEAVEDGLFAVVDDRPRTVGRVELPVGDGHLAGQDEGDGAREEAEGDQDPAADLEQAADADLRHEGRSSTVGAGHPAEPAEPLQAADLEEH